MTDQEKQIREIISRNSIEYFEKSKQDQAKIYVDDFVNELLAAISVTRCSTELRDEKTLTFEEWAYKMGFTIGDKYNYVDMDNNNWLKKDLRKLYNRLTKP